MTNFADLLLDKAELNSFARFLVNHHAEELLEFWIEVELYRVMSLSAERIVSGRAIFDNFITPEAPKQLNLPEPVRLRVVVAVKNFDVDDTTFNEAQGVILRFMEHDSIPRFVSAKKSSLKDSGSKETTRLTKLVSELFHQRTTPHRAKKSKVLQRIGKVFSPGTLRVAPRSPPPGTPPEAESAANASRLSSMLHRAVKKVRSSQNLFEVHGYDSDQSSLTRPRRNSKASFSINKLRRDLSKGSKEDLKDNLRSSSEFSFDEADDELRSSCDFLPPSRPASPLPNVNIAAIATAINTTTTTTPTTTTRNTSVMTITPPPLRKNSIGLIRKQSLSKKDRSLSDPFIFEDFRAHLRNEARP